MARRINYRAAGARDVFRRRQRRAPHENPTVDRAGAPTAPSCPRRLAAHHRRTAVAGANSLHQPSAGAPRIRGAGPAALPRGSRESIWPSAPASNLHRVRRRDRLRRQPTADLSRTRRLGARCERRGRLDGLWPCAASYLLRGAGSPRARFRPNTRARASAGRAPAPDETRACRQMLIGVLAFAVEAVAATSGGRLPAAA